MTLWSVSPLPTEVTDCLTEARHVLTGNLQTVRQDDLDRLRPARGSGDAVGAERAAMHLFTRAAEAGRPAVEALLPTWLSANDVQPAARNRLAIAMTSAVCSSYGLWPA